MLSSSISKLAKTSYRNVNFPGQLDELVVFRLRRKIGQIVRERLSNKPQKKQPFPCGGSCFAVCALFISVA
jgi:hypothetical protein